MLIAKRSLHFRPKWSCFCVTWQAVRARGRGHEGQDKGTRTFPPLIIYEGDLKGDVFIPPTLIGTAAGKNNVFGNGDCVIVG